MAEAYHHTVHRSLQMEVGAHVALRDGCGTDGGNRGTCFHRISLRDQDLV